MTVHGNGVRVIPIGGVGEFGANATIIQTKETCVLVDYGLMFPPDTRQPGVDFYVNDPELLLEQFPDLSALFVTHAHEDHIGGVGFLLEKRELQIYAMPYTAQMLERALDFFDVSPKIKEVSLNEAITHGDISVEFIGVTHSIAQACALAITTPDGTILHTGDFKVDPLPADNYPFQSQRLREIGKQGVDLLIMDSTNALKDGFCPSDHELVPHIEEVIREAKGRVFFTTFSSHMPRLKHLKKIARATGRKIALIGRGFRKHFEISVNTKYIENFPDLFISSSRQDVPDKELIYVVTGSQAEQQSALVRICKDGFKGIRIRSGDRVIFSSKSIPGNERQIALLASDLERIGAEVVTTRNSHVHASGHGYREDVAYMLSLTNPKTVAPIHGEFVMLLNHFQWMRSLVREDQQTLLIEDGDVLMVKNGDVKLDGRRETRLLPIDGVRVKPISCQTLRERKDMMYAGMVLVNANIKAGPPEQNTYQVDAHGMVELEPGEIGSRVETILQSLQYIADASRSEWNHAIFTMVKKAMKREFGVRPLIKVVINGVVTR